MLDAEAEVAFRKNYHRGQIAFGKKHQKTLVAMYQIGFVLTKQGRLTEAEAIYCETLEYE